MPKLRREMTKEERILFNQMKKLVNSANSRIVRLEKLTGEKGSFGVKQLYDYLDTSTIGAITTKGLISTSSKFNSNQMIAIIKATKDFLQSDATRVSEIRQKVLEFSEKTGKPISFSQANVLYQSGKNYQWIYEYIPKSEFWRMVKVAKENGWDRETFIDQISIRANLEVDEKIKNDLIALEIYVME